MVGGTRSGGKGADGDRGSERETGIREKPGRQHLRHGCLLFSSCHSCASLDDPIICTHPTAPLSLTLHLSISPSPDDDDDASSRLTRSRFKTHTKLMSSRVSSSSHQTDVNSLPESPFSDRIITWECSNVKPAIRPGVEFFFRNSFGM